MSDITGTKDDNSADEGTSKEDAAADTQGNVENYIGVDPMYQNAAYPDQEPLLAEEGPDKELEERALEHQAHMDELSAGVNPLTGHSFVAPHPSEATNPASNLIASQKQGSGGGGRSKR